MKIQINTDNNIEGSDEFIHEMQAVLESALDRFAEHITRVEVHLSDENSSHKGGNDKRCIMEARMERMQPVVVTDQAETIEEAVNGAADKLERLIDHELGRLSDRKTRA